MVSDVAYARSGGVAIAHTVMGEGDVDLIFVPDYMSNLVFGMRYPRWRRFYESLAERFRLIVFDKRGTGLSDHGGQFATLETRMEDMHAVLDAVGSTRTVVLASHEGCAMATLYAASYPERTTALVLFHPNVVGEAHRDPTAAMAELADMRERWGTQELADDMIRDGCPSLLTSDEDRALFADYLRVGASPAVAYSLNRAFAEVDLTGVLPAVRVPTLVLYRAPEQRTADEVAARVPNARCVRVSGDDYLEIYLSPEIADEISRFVAGGPVPDVPDTVLVTVMFTDIVGSTERAIALGDAAWRDLLAAHHDAVRRALTLFRGEERDTAGDGFFATFDGPARAIRCAQAIVAAVEPLGLRLRIGIHIGECELHEGKVTGMAVVVGARIAALAGPGEVLVSGTARDLVAGSGLEFSERGDHELKGLPGTWPIHVAR
ncbi:MAG TPA: adenylate/guanylate cyclase domain-containing protein [Gaiellales bacterium]|nr:adenylate/guanylate cyclase domain-containing protein [Gaiellales bacterium]